MKLQSQCCTRSQAIRLHELGVSQQAHLFWWDFPMDACLVTVKNKNRDGSVYPYYAAFTVAELGAMLPRNFATFHCGYEIWRIANTFNYANGTDSDGIGRHYFGQIKTYTEFVGETEAQVRAAFLIHLLENDLLPVDSVNYALQNS